MTPPWQTVWFTQADLLVIYDIDGRGEKYVNLTLKALKWCTHCCEEIHAEFMHVLTTMIYEEHPILIKIAPVC